MTRHQNIFMGCIVLITAFVIGGVSWSLIPRFDVLVYPAKCEWPQDMVLAARRFSTMSPAERGNESIVLRSFFVNSCEQKRVRPLDYIIARSTIIRPQELEEIMGSPSFKLRNSYYYFYDANDGHSRSLVFTFQYHALVSVGLSAGEEDWKNIEY